MTLLTKLFSAGHTFSPQMKSLLARATHSKENSFVAFSRKVRTTTANWRNGGGIGLLKRGTKDVSNVNKGDDNLDAEPIKKNKILDEIKRHIKKLLQEASYVDSQGYKSFDKLTILFGGETPDEGDGSGGNKQQRQLRMTKVVTDIDDTVVSSGGHSIFGIALGGVDNQYKRGQFYPGCIQFALEMSLHNLRAGRMGTRAAESNGDDTPQLELPAKISVLTARAKEFKFALALKKDGKLNRAYQSLGMKNGLEDWGIGEVYYGSVVEWVLQNRKGIRKSANFGLMIEEDEKAGRGIDKYVFIGDTGEKDYEAGERMAKEHPTRLKAIFMHNVYKMNTKLNKVKNSANSGDTTTENAESQVSGAALMEDKVINGVPVMYFRTYVGAAVKAYERRMISKEALKRVAAQSVADLQLVTQHPPRPKPQGRFFPRSITDEVDKLSPKSYLRELAWKRKQARIESQWSELIADLEQVPFLRSYIPPERQKSPIESDQVEVLAASVGNNSFQQMKRFAFRQKK